MALSFLFIWGRNFAVIIISDRTRFSRDLYLEVDDRSGRFVSLLSMRACMIVVVIELSNYKLASTCCLHFIPRNYSSKMDFTMPILDRGVTCLTTTSDIPKLKKKIRDFGGETE